VVLNAISNEFADNIGARKLSKEERIEYTVNPKKE
jgi:hypothetical protein